MALDEYAGLHHQCQQDDCPAEPDPPGPHCECGNYWPCPDVREIDGTDIHGWRKLALDANRAAVKAMVERDEARARPDADTTRLPHADVRGLTPETCPERESHGSPFRYCPVKGCGWHEGMGA